MKWLTVAGALIVGAGIVLVLRLGWDGIDDLGLTRLAAVAFTLGGMLVAGLGIALLRLLGRKHDSSHRSDKPPADGEQHDQ